MPLDPDTQDQVLDQLFRTARTHTHWRDEAVSDDLLRELYDLAKMAPTSANCSPARFVFLRTPVAKQRLKPALSAGNIDKTMAAPVTVIVAEDPRFYDQLPKLFPHTDARSWFAGNLQLATATANRNTVLQGAYLILAARLLGLDCGPMSGFDNDVVDREFFAASGYRSNFLINLGYGDPTQLKPRAPRLEFNEACQLL